MSDQHHVFQTAAGFAAIGWRGERVVRFRLPAPTLGETEGAMRRGWTTAPADPPPAIRAAIDRVVGYFAGERVDFADVAIDTGPQQPFFADVYALVRGLGWGETTTYGAVAAQLGAGPAAAQAVGQAMARNPVPLIIPCHRVTAAGGRIGGFSAPGGSMSKARMLEMEGITLSLPSKPSAQTSFGF